MNLLDCFCWYFTGPPSAMFIPQIFVETTALRPFVSLSLVSFRCFWVWNQQPSKFHLSSDQKHPKTLFFLVWNRQFYCPLLEGDAFKKDQQWTNFWIPKNLTGSCQGSTVGSPLQNKTLLQAWKPKVPTEGVKRSRSFWKQKTLRFLWIQVADVFFPILLFWKFPSVYTSTFQGVPIKP